MWSLGISTVCVPVVGCLPGGVISIRCGLLTMSGRNRRLDRSDRAYVYQHPAPVNRE